MGTAFCAVVVVKRATKVIGAITPQNRILVHQYNISLFLLKNHECLVFC